MNRIHPFILSAVLSGLAVTATAQNTNVLTDENSRVSYAIGMLTGTQWKQQSLDFDADIYARGIKDAQSGKPTLLTTAEAQAAIDAFKKTFAVKRQQMQAQLAVKNRTEGEAFLAANKDKPGVRVLPDGLQYQVITSGSGETPTAADTVTVNYAGSLLDGTEFDSSYKRGEPMTFSVTGVIKGWTEALQKMKVGSKWKLFIPSDLAYGEPGYRGIPPNSVLIFEVELLSVQGAPPPPAPLTSDIIKVPSAEEMKRGAKIETIKAEDAAKAQAQAQSTSQK